MKSKKDLRKLIRNKKGEYTLEQLKKLSVSILEKLEHHPAFLKSNTILLYYALNDEVQTEEFIKKWAAKKEIILPVVKGDILELKRYHPNETTIGAYGITEPTGKTFSAYQEIELAVIPGMAFDKLLNRLGRGKGYYDRLLPQLECCKIGLCFSFQLQDEQIPTDKHDIKMDYVISDKIYQ